MSDQLIQRICDQYKPLLEDLVYKGLSRDDADDVMQEVLIKAVKKRHQLQDPAKLKAWMAKIAEREANRYLKKQAKRWETELAVVTNLETGQEIDIYELVGDEEMVEKIVCEAERKQMLYTLIGLLNEKERVIFIRHNIHGYMHREIAADLGIKETTVRSIYSRTCKKLPAMAEQLFRKEDRDPDD